MCSSHALGGAATLSGTSGFTSMITFNRSSTTLSPLSLPSLLMSSTLFSASLAASSSAFLLPLVCCCNTGFVSMLYVTEVGDEERVWSGFCQRRAAYVGLELFELSLFLCSVVFNLFLGFGFGVSYTLRAVWWMVNDSASTLSFSEGVNRVHSLAATVSSSIMCRSFDVITLLYNFLCFPLRLWEVNISFTRQIVSCPYIKESLNAGGILCGLGSLVSNI